MKTRFVFWFAFILIITECALLVESKRREAEKEEGRVRSVRSPDTDKSLFGETLDGKTDPNEFEGDIQSENQNLEKNKKTPLGFLPLPPGYNKFVIPLGDISKELFVRVYLLIREVLDVDFKNGIVELDTELGISWIDWQVWKHFIQDKEAQEKAKTGSAEWILDAEFLKQIWKPDIFIEQMASVERTSILAKLISLKFLVRNEILPGSINFRSRQSFKIRCEMDFHYYPADVQNCPINIRSYSYPQEQLFLMWYPRQKVFLDQIKDPNYDFQVSGVEPGEKLYDLFTTSQAICCNRQNFSTLTFNLEIRRNLKYHVLQTCLPSVLLIWITWLCFLLPPDMVEVRIGISMTTLLTLTAMFTAVREQSPDVSYPMAIDYWMVFCIILLFIALVLFTVLYWLRRQVKNFKEGKGEGEQVADVPTRRHSTVDQLEQQKRYIRIVGYVRRYTFLFFALCFVIFLVVFSGWILIYSKQLEWDPSPTYNALPLEDEKDESNRLFALQEDEFEPGTKDEDKVVESTFRFRDIFKDVIVKNLVRWREKPTEVVVETTTALAVAATVNTTTAATVNTTTAATVNTTTAANTNTTLSGSGLAVADTVNTTTNATTNSTLSG